MIKQTHKILLSSGRGEHKMPGEYRISQNRIGGSSPADATFIPPHQDYVPALMGDLENFLHNTVIKVPSLIKIAIAHYQFETIHPFLDGNGRIGRLLITLFLVDQKILTKPLLYLSTYFEQNKSLYYDNLTFVRTKNDLKQWLKYFLLGIAETAEQAVQTLSGVLQLKMDLESKIIHDFGRKSKQGTILLHQLFKQPVVTVKEVETLTGLSFKAANDLVGKFVKANILKETTGQTRNRLFIFHDYIHRF